MYLQHFKLTKKPFELSPSPEFLHLSSKHKMALSLLEYGIYEQSGITVITGEIGSGKTTLIRNLLTTADYSQLEIGLINNTHSSHGYLIHWVAMAFGIEHEHKDEVKLFKEIQAKLIDNYSKGKTTVLIVDEAQNMSASALEELRLFTNINGGDDHLVKVVLIGQPELADLLTRPELFQIAQRVSVEYHINALTLSETSEYIHHRMKVAGANERAFSEDAIAVIYYYTGGVPRLINTLSDCALVYAYASDQNKVTMEIAKEATEGRKIGGINRRTTTDLNAEKVRQDLLLKTGVDISALGSAKQ